MPSTPVKAGKKQDLIFQTLYPGNNQTVNVSSSSTQSSAFGADASIVRLFSTKDCWVRFGTNPTVTAGSNALDIFVPGGIIQFFGVVGSQKLAVIRTSSDGTLYLFEGAIV